MGTESRGASNAKAKRELGWTLRYPSWRQGFVAAYAHHPRPLRPRLRSAGRAALEPPTEWSVDCRRPSPGRRQRP